MTMAAGCTGYNSSWVQRMMNDCMSYAAEALEQSTLPVRVSQKRRLEGIGYLDVSEDMYPL